MNVFLMIIRSVEVRKQRRTKGDGHEIEKWRFLKHKKLNIKKRKG